MPTRCETKGQQCLVAESDPFAQPRALVRLASRESAFIESIDLSVQKTAMTWDCHSVSSQTNG
jgi:hypothetical protein